MRRLALLFVLFGFVVACRADDGPDVARVFKVFDGSTLLARTRYRSLRLRLAGVQTPSTRYAEGQASKQILERMLLSKRVQYTPVGAALAGVQAALVQLDDRDINIEMIRTGYAWVWPRDSGRYAELFDAEQQARQERRGVWADATSAAPWETLAD